MLDHVDALQIALADPDRLGSRIVLLDAVGHVQAIGLGELLASRRPRGDLRVPAADADGRSTARPAWPRFLAPCGPGCSGGPTPRWPLIGDHDVTVVDVLSMAFDTITDVDTVVIRTTGLPNDALATALEGRIPDLHVIGDAVAVRPADRAIFEGHRVGRTL